MKQPPLSPEALRFTLLQILKNGTSSQGMTQGEVAEKCPMPWKRGVAVMLGCDSQSVGVEQVKRFVYELWMEGEIFVEPPGPGMRAARLWHPDHAAKHFRSVAKSKHPEAEKKSPVEPQDGLAAVRKVYNKFLPEHPSGAVNIYKIRRELGWEDTRFEQLLNELRIQPDSPVEFLGGDPQNFSDTQRAQSFSHQGTTYFSILWRQHPH